MVEAVERDLILRYIAEHPGMTEGDLLDRLADPATEEVVREALAQLREHALITVDERGGHHAG